MMKGCAQGPSVSRAGTMTLMFAAAVVAMATPTALTAQMTPPPDFLVTVPASGSFDETLANLKQAIEAENLMVVHEINAQQMLRMVGVRVGGMRQILYFHPRFMKSILDANRNGGIVAPLKILVMETPDGRVMIRYHDPVKLFGPYEGLGGIAAELKAITERVVATVRGG